MWPLDHARDVIRIGREWIDLWSSTKAGLVHRGRQPMLYFGSADALAHAVAELLVIPAGEGDRRGVRVPLDFVLESAWMPVALLELGDAVLNPSQVRTLLHHRVAQIYGATPTTGGEWELISEVPVGGAQGMGYALSSVVRQSLQAIARNAHRRPNSIQPACAWGRERFRRQAPRRGWWLWCEQDRTLVAYLHGGCVRALNPSAPHTTERGSGAMTLVRMESVRHGLSMEAMPTAVAGWTHAELGEASTVRDNQIALLVVEASQPSGTQQAQTVVAGA